MRKEDKEEKPYILFTITDEEGNVVRKIKSDPKYGINRIAWDFRYSATTPVKIGKENTSRYGEGSSGPLALPGKYFVSLAKSNNGNKGMPSDGDKIKMQLKLDTEFLIQDMSKFVQEIHMKEIDIKGLLDSNVLYNINK